MVRLEFSLCFRYSVARAVTVIDVINGECMEYMSALYCTDARRKYISYIKRPII
jgi:hypothetical protein